MRGSLSFLLLLALAGCSRVEGQFPASEERSAIGGDMTWIRVETVPAGPRLETVLVYDPTANNFVAVGGRNVDWEILDETWKFDVASRQWSRIETIRSPGVRFMHNMVYDSRNDRMILFGGFDGHVSLGDLWTFDPAKNVWDELPSANGPPPRQLHAMAFDSLDNRLIVFGGRFQRGSNLRQYGDTWLFDFDTGVWLESTPEVSPSPRDHATMIFNDNARLAVLFGGDASGTSQNDTWVYDPRVNRWTSMEPSNPPSPRDHHLLAYRPRSADVLLVGGSFEDEGIYRYEHEKARWLELEFSGSPPPFGDHMLGALGGNQFVLFGGFRRGEHPLDETWLLNVDWD